MKNKLSHKETLMVGSMLFGMFFGAGNLIFPVHMGQLAGHNVYTALIGFILTGVGLPLLGVVSLGQSRCSSLFEMASKVGTRYGKFFTCALYLTIGPLFAIPRCATTSFTVGLEPLCSSPIALLLFSVVFFTLVLLFSFRSGKIMVWIGKYLNPIFLLFFGSLIIIALLRPMASVSQVIPAAGYDTGALFRGFLEGYNTMDALAGLAFGIVVINSIKDLGVEEPKAVAAAAAKSGILCAVLMAIIYWGACMIGTQSRGGFEVSENGGIALSQICSHYLGSAGQLFLAITVTLACLKTAIGLVTSISQTFAELFTGGKYYEAWDISFCIFSLIVSNVGLNALIHISLPVLMFLYPLSITLILLTLAGRSFGYDKRVYRAVTAFTAAAAFLDFLKGFGILALDGIAAKYLPFYTYGLGWVCPAGIGIILGLFLMNTNPRPHSS